MFTSWKWQRLIRGSELPPSPARWRPGPGDTWSDVDVAFGIADGTPLEPVLEDWMKGIDQEFGVLDQFDSRTGSWMYRVFLLSSGLQVDVGVTPAGTFGARPKLPSALRHHASTGVRARTGALLPHRTRLALPASHPVMH